MQASCPSPAGMTEEQTVVTKTTLERCPWGDVFQAWDRPAQHSVSTMCGRVFGFLNVTLNSLGFLLSDKEVLGDLNLWKWAEQLAF